MFKIRFLAWTAFFFSSFLVASAQQAKSAYDIAAIDHWPSISEGQLSPDGHFVTYIIKNEPYKHQTLVVAGTQEPKSSFQEMRIVDGAQAIFSKNSKHLIFKVVDTLCIYELDKRLIQKIPEVNDSKVFNDDKGQRVFYKSTDNRLFSLDPPSNRKEFLGRAIHYSVSKNGQVVFVYGEGTSSNSYTISRIFPGQLNRNSIIWRGRDTVSELVTDQQGTQAAFKLKNGSNGKAEIWYFNNDNQTAQQVAACKRGMPDKDFEIDRLIGFGADGKNLFINLKVRRLGNSFKKGASVDIWSYNDATVLGCQRTRDDYLGLINLSNKHIIRLEQEGDNIPLNLNPDVSSMIGRHAEGTTNERNWNGRSSQNLFLFSVENNKRIDIPIFPWPCYRNKNFIIGFDQSVHDILSYDVASGKLLNLTEHLNIPQHDEHADCPDNLQSRGLKVAGWSSKYDKLIVYDYYDIWLIDPANAQLPICLTGGEGRRDGIVFRLSNVYTATDRYDNKIFDFSCPVLLSAFDTKTKDDGYYRVFPRSKNSLQRLTMAAFVYEGNSVPRFGAFTNVTVSGNAGYLVPRSSSKESPNYFFTRNFEEFTPISQLHPEKNYNGSHSKLLSYTTELHDTLQAAVFLPENFNQNRKYPVIINYYEQRSNELNAFQLPELSWGWINIPWFVSRGYIVCTPDIKFYMGHPGESALASITGLTAALQKLPYVDVSKIGIQGASFSGFTTNYIVTHSDKFAAAVSQAGVSDAISFSAHILDHFAVVGLGTFTEFGQFRLNSTPWERPDLYVENSPVFNAQKVKTPLLLINNKGDNLVPFSQGLEMFFALRRLGKKSWLLQYDGAGHHVDGTENAIDYTLRMTQFFDFYLKGAPAPKWMVEGVPANLKGIKDRLELMPAGIEPGPGLNNSADLEKIKKYSLKTTEAISKP